MYKVYIKHLNGPRRRKWEVHTFMVKYNTELVTSRKQSKQNRRKQSTKQTSEIGLLENHLWNIAEIHPGAPRIGTISTTIQGEVIAATI